jgi:ABC-type dipeptide/oligopeptide/nickel transport system permease subunit
MKGQPFLEACHSLGLSHGYIILRHIFPNLFGIIITYVMMTIPSVILYESFLSFLGLGIESPLASLGSLISRGVPQINPVRIYWWLIAFPTLTLAGLLIALNFIGDGLREAFDPKSTRR